jgi:hypothetical protein
MKCNQSSESYCSFVFYDHVVAPWVLWSQGRTPMGWRRSWRYDFAQSISLWLACLSSHPWLWQYRHQPSWATVRGMTQESVTIERCSVILTRPRGPILGASDEPPGASPPVTRTITRDAQRTKNWTWSRCTTYFHRQRSDRIWDPWYWLLMFKNR